MSDQDIQAELEEMRRMGSISSSEWQAYTWKNELAEQRERLLRHLAEALVDAEPEHSPYHMLERAIGVAAVCMRRLIERRLVTDRFRDSMIDVHEICARRDTEWREPFVSQTASNLFNNYDLRSRQVAKHSPKVISDKFLHARVIAVLGHSAYLPDGLLIASDTQSRTQLYHFTPDELANVIDAFLKDKVLRTFDGYVLEDGKVPSTQKVIATRD